MKEVTTHNNNNKCELQRRGNNLQRIETKSHIIYVCLYGVDARITQLLVQQCPSSDSPSKQNKYISAIQ